MDKNRKKAIRYLVMASVLWSIGGLFIKLIDWNPMAISGARSGIAAVVMLFYLRKPKLHFNKMMLFGAICYSSLLILFVSANKLTTSANAILLEFTSPIWVALFSWWFLKEKIQKYDWFSITFVMAGMCLFFLQDLQGGHQLGNLIAIMSGIAMAGMVIFLKLQKESSPIEMTLLGNVFTFIICLPFFFGSAPNLQSIAALLVLGIFQLGVSYILYTKAIPHVSAIEAILISVLEPLLNPLWVFWITGELPGRYALWGGMIVIITVVARGLYQANKKALPREEQVHCNSD